MINRDDKPEGYYDEIEYPQERKDDVLSLFSDYEIIEHTNKEPDYDDFMDNDVALEIVNPHGKNNLFIELAGEFTICFSDWHAHFSPYEYDYGEMKKDAVSIINGKLGVCTFYVEERWLGGMLLKDKVPPFPNPAALIEEMDFSEDRIKMIREKGAVIHIDYWNDCSEFEIKKGSIEPKD